MGITFFLLAAGNWFGADKEVSFSERRVLKKRPELTIESVLSGQYSTEFEAYVKDQFLLRDTFRKIKGMVELKVWQKKDNHGIYQVEDSLYQIEDALYADRVASCGKRFVYLMNKFFPDADGYYAVIPDKSFFLESKEMYPGIPYEAVNQIMQENMADIQQIPIVDTLSGEDYYRTDLHWKQEAITDTADRILERMAEENIGKSMPLKEYDAVIVYPEFVGGYAGQWGMKVEPDTIVCLENQVIHSIDVYDYEENGRRIPVYAEEKLTGIDGYDVYLYGPRALLQMKNPQQNNKRTLIVFRDSFGSSIAPLLAKAYQEIWLIDLRYIKEEALETYLGNYENCDVLFLYHTALLNKGM